MTCTPTSSPTRLCGGGAGIGGRFHRRDITAHDGGHQPGVDLLPSDERDVGGLHHGVGGFHHADEPACFDEAKCFAELWLRLLSMIFRAISTHLWQADHATTVTAPENRDSGSAFDLR